MAARIGLDGLARAAGNGRREGAVAIEQGRRKPEFGHLNSGLFYRLELHHIGARYSQRTAENLHLSCAGKG